MAGYDSADPITAFGRDNMPKSLHALLKKAL